MVISDCVTFTLPDLMSLTALFKGLDVPPKIGRISLAHGSSFGQDVLPATTNDTRVPVTVLMNCN